MRGFYLIAFCAFTFTSCVIVDVSDEFNAVAGDTVKSGGFVPSLRIRQNRSRAPVPPFRLDIDRMPRDLVLSQSDPTVLKTDAGFRKFWLEYCYIEFADGTRVDCIDPKLPISKRTFLIRPKKDPYQNEVFTGVISKRMSFKIHMKGVSVREDGRKFPFTRVRAYRYDGKSTGVKTIFQEWADV